MLLFVSVHLKKVLMLLTMKIFANHRRFEVKKYLPDKNN